ncbi:MAG: hypothetical protein P1U91_09095 [Pseudophaeobacter sp. bin_em_oilr2.035]|uniref:hypothetical protein n=1 Tax=Phaeobacter gallaeciensis TaxID=60890 RepID=UPI0010576B55|nr:hypothetical protein [Phaeobacter gallaeciensis]MDF1772099.1 hypothetical protein [Pseudophaeobacter sp. bin_em_oilr2.035]MEE2817900.1 hypothetical protein [Pseudomonadota bacterium]MDE4145782.1 hypothetical protein [Phaeobacter gallaeciensis]MDE4162632.1 hypothetical protein [Phaeobacter gallaeciensis]MDE4171278.1 hypothetical protein [Phaeobacter gallaeciensis]
MAWMPPHGGITMCQVDIGERHRGRRDLPGPWYRTARPVLSETATLEEKLAHQAAPEVEFDEMFKPSMDLLASLWKILEKGFCELKRMALRMAFTDPISVSREIGLRTA